MASWKPRLAAIALACWVVFLVVLLTLDKSPTLSAWAGPPHFSSSVFLALTVAGFLVAWRYAKTALTTGWWTLVTLAALVVGLELVQQLSSARSFQVQDIIDGVAGGATGALLGAWLLRLLGADRFVGLALLQSLLVPVVTLALVLMPSTPPKVDDPNGCDATSPPVDWTRVYIERFAAQGDQIRTGAAVLCRFADGVDARGGALVLDGGGVQSAPLSGLLQALSASGQITFAVRFRSAELARPKRPGVVAAIVRNGRSGLFVGRVVATGKNLATAIRLNRHESTSTQMVGRLTDRYHEVAIVYDGQAQTTYFDGEVVGYERTMLAPPTGSDVLTLELGWRSDGHWLPFRGEIASILIASRAVSGAEVAGLFAHLQDR